MGRVRHASFFQTLALICTSIKMGQLMERHKWPVVVGPDHRFHFFETCGAPRSL